MNGAYRTLKKAEKRMLNFRKFDIRYTEMIDYHQLVHDTSRAVNKVSKGEPYSFFPIRLVSDSLERLATQTESSMILLPAGSDAVIHKHMLRDRSDILAEREKKKRRPH